MFNSNTLHKFLILAFLFFSVASLAGGYDRKGSSGAMQDDFGICKSEACIEKAMYSKADFIQYQLNQYKAQRQQLDTEIRALVQAGSSKTDSDIRRLEKRIDTVEKAQREFINKSEQELEKLGLERAYVDSLSNHIDWWIGLFGFLAVFITYFITNKYKESVDSQLKLVELSQKQISDKEELIKKQAQEMSEKLQESQILLNELKEHKEEAAEIVSEVRQLNEVDNESEEEKEERNKELNETQKSEEGSAALAALAEQAFNERDYFLAIKLYRQLTKLHPTNRDYLFNLAYCLFELAAEKSGDEKIKLLEESKFFYESLIAIKEGFVVLSNLGNTMRLLWSLTNNSSYLDGAIDHLSTAIDRNGDYAYAHGNICLCFQGKAETKKSTEEKEQYLKKALSHAKKAIEINPNYVNAHSYMGEIYTSLSMTEDVEKSREFSRAAITSLKKCLDIEPSRVNDLNSISHNYISLFYLDEDTSHLDTAIEFCLLAEKEVRGSGAYNLACAYSLLTNEVESKAWLELALDTGKLDDKELLKSDSDLEYVRSSNWFKDLLEKL